MSSLSGSVSIKVSNKKKKSKRKKRLELDTLSKLERKIKDNFDIYKGLESLLNEKRSDVIDESERVLDEMLTKTEKSEFKNLRSEEFQLFMEFERAFENYLASIANWTEEFKACVQLCSEKQIDDPKLVEDFLEQMRDSKYFQELCNIKVRELPWLLEPGDIEYGMTPGNEKALLGHGAFGNVYRGICHGVPVAIKEILVRQGFTGGFENFKHECEIMSTLRHKNIILFIGGCFEKDNIRIVTEIAVNGSLEDALYGHINSNKKQIIFSDQKKLTILRDIATALNWLHNGNPQILHLDIKPDNILLDKDYNPKLADFGISIKTSEPGTSFAGTPGYIAPELFSVRVKVPPSPKSDSYSFGVLVWELMTEKSPTDVEIIGNKKSLIYFGEKASEGLRAIPPLETGPDLIKDMVEQCLLNDPQPRISIDTILGEKIFENGLRSYYGNSSFESFWEQFTVSVPQHDLDDLELARKVPWNIFFDTFVNYYGLPPSLNDEDDYEKQCTKQCIKDIFGIRSVKLEDEFVTKEKYLNFYSFFRNLIDNENRDVNKILNFITDLYKEKWWFGFITRDKSEELLSIPDNPCYLLRGSSTAGCYTISSSHIDRKSKKVSYQHTQPVSFEKCDIAEIRSHVKNSTKVWKRSTKPAPDWPGLSIFTGTGKGMGYDTINTY